MADRLAEAKFGDMGWFCPKCNRLLDQPTADEWVAFIVNCECGTAVWHGLYDVKIENGRASGLVRLDARGKGGV